MSRRIIEPSRPLELAYKSIEDEFSSETGSTRRGLVKGAAGVLGGMAALTVPGSAATALAAGRANKPETILAVAATAEVLATIVNTIGPRKVNLDKVTEANVRAAAYQEKVHFEVLTDVLGAKPVTRKIWVPDAVFKNATNLLSTLEVGDQIFINAYMIGTTVFGRAGQAKAARYTAEFMGVEAVHRALARQSLNKLGNDRAFMKYDGKETAPGAPNRGQRGFTDVLDAVKQLEAAGFGFGKKGDGPGRFYEYGEVAKLTPEPKGVNTLKLQ